MKSTKIFNSFNKSLNKLSKGDIFGSAMALGTAVYGVTENTIRTTQMIKEQNKLYEEEQRKQQEEQLIYEKTFNRISGMLAVTNNKLFFMNIKTSFSKDNDMTQYTKFYVFNDMKMEIEDVTLDIYLLSGKMFNVNLKHGDLQNTMKFTNTDFIYFQETLRKIFGNISFKSL